MPDEPAATTPTAPTASRPRTLVVAAVILLIEGLVCVVLGVLDAVNVRGNRPVVGIGGAMILVGYGIVLGGLLTRGLLRMRPWSRGPVVATQLINLPIAWSFFGAVTWPISLALGVASLVVIGCVLHPASTRVLVTDRDGD